MRRASTRNDETTHAKWERLDREWLEKVGWYSRLAPHRLKPLPRKTKQLTLT